MQAAVCEECPKSGIYGYYLWNELAHDHDAEASGRPAGFPWHGGPPFLVLGDGASGPAKQLGQILRGGCLSSALEVCRDTVSNELLVLVLELILREYFVNHIGWTAFEYTPYAMAQQVSRRGRLFGTEQFPLPLTDPDWALAVSLDLVSLVQHIRGLEAHNPGIWKSGQGFPLRQAHECLPLIRANEMVPIGIQKRASFLTIASLPEAEGDLPPLPSCPLVRMPQRMALRSIGSVNTSEQPTGGLHIVLRDLAFVPSKSQQDPNGISHPRDDVGALPNLNSIGIATHCDGTPHKLRGSHVPPFVIQRTCRPVGRAMMPAAWDLVIGRVANRLTSASNPDFLRLEDIDWEYHPDYHQFLCSDS
ncbi:hypothetical protein BJ170DRAFT_593260 [Xylariales sp. AK1849]|nr:hypothetical protein BJ170DRAFT_593260 [Xylariales sp. AK1849]